MIKKYIVNHSSSILVISLVILLIYYNYFTDVAENTHHKIDLFASSEQRMWKEDIKNVTRFPVNLSNVVEDKCSQLYKIARDMLRGERIRLPFETKRTRWKFHGRGNLVVLNKTSLRWNYPWYLARNEKLYKTYFRRYGEVKAKDIKVRKYFITFANNCCNKSKLTAMKFARYPGGFDFTTIHDMNSLSKGFRRSHSFILRHKRGSGFWLWKPYIILKTLVENMVEGDVVMYQDAGAYFIRDAGPLLKLSQDRKNGILVFHTRFKEKHFSKRDAFVLMNMDDNRVYETFQRLGAFLVVHKNCKSLQFVMEWMAYASDPRILTDMDNQVNKENIAGFSDNRHDQTVLSLLSKKWGITAFRDPSQYGEEAGQFMYAAGPYEQLINHSRDRD